MLFDWDNTLADNWGVVAVALNAAFAAFGLPSWTLDETRRRVRRSLRDSFPDMFGPDWPKARDIFYETFERRHLDLLAPLPDADAMLRDLKAQGLYLAVVSNKMGRLLRRETEKLGWDNLFGAVIGANDAVRDKPAPEPAALALAPSGLSSGPEIWYVGDTEVDMEFSRNTGLSGILLRAEPPDAAAFAGRWPARHVTGCRDLLTLIQSL